MGGGAALAAHAFLAGGPGRTARGLLPPSDAGRDPLPGRGRHFLAGDARRLPAWARGYAFFRRWRENGPVAEFHDRLRGRVREREGGRRSRRRGSSTRSR